MNENKREMIVHGTPHYERCTCGLLGYENIYSLYDFSYTLGRHILWTESQICVDYMDGD
jgi:hypothetical protein